MGKGGQAKNCMRARSQQGRSSLRVSKAFCISHEKKENGTCRSSNIQCKNKIHICRSCLLDPLCDEPPPGVVGEVVGAEHLALDEGLQVLNLEMAHLRRSMYFEC